MNILIALDSFKGSLDSISASLALESGLKKAFSKKGKSLACTIMPMSDGGDGLLDSIKYQYDIESKSYRLESTKVHSPYMQEISATYILDDSIAIMEMATSTGLTLTPIEKRRTLYASSYGLGEMIKDAYNKGARKIILGVGGSATNDAGAGCLQALGVRFYNNGMILESINANSLSKIDCIDDSLRLDIEIEILCDVANPLLGKNGATYIYGKQKGVIDNDLEILESNMLHFANKVEGLKGNTYRDIAGSGAAGGVVFGFKAFYNAGISKGVEKVLSLLNAEKKIANADIIITGEGCLDKQSAFGKVPFGIAKMAKSLNKPVIAICGSLGDGYMDLHDYIDSMFSIVNKPMELKEAMENANSLLEGLGVEIGGLLALH